LRSKTEDHDLVLVGLVQLGEFAAELVFGDVWSVWVEDITKRIFHGHQFSSSLRGGVFESPKRSGLGWQNECDLHDHLPSAEQLIADEFAGSQGDGRFSVGHIG
jgi:hypothetical protein